LILLQGGAVARVADFVPGNPELQPFVPVQDSGYKVIQKGLNVGAVPYGDRGYKIEKLPPAFAGLTLLQTKAGHKAVADATYSIITSASKPCLVFVALDQRLFPIYAQHGAPGWLNEYARTYRREDKNRRSLHGASRCGVPGVCPKVRWRPHRVGSAVDGHVI
jgi:hypothetical protein